MNKKLRIREIFSIILGSIIGWGCFMLPGEKFLPTAGVINTSIAIILGTISILFIEKNYRFMMENNINQGGEFSYILNFMGPKNAFFLGWFLMFSYIILIPLNATAFPLIIDKMFPGCLHFGYLYNIAGENIYLGNIFLSTIIILIFMFLNIKGIKETGNVQFLIVSSLILCFIVVVIGMFVTSDLNEFYSNYIVNYKFDVNQILQIFSITPYLFIGFEAVPKLVNDFKVSRKMASNITFVALIFGMIIYLFLNLATALAYGLDEILGLDWALGAGVLKNLGNIGFIILLLAIVGAVIGGINGFMICSNKVISSMLEEKLLLVHSSKKVGDRNKYILVVVSIISIFASFFGRNIVLWIVDLCSVFSSVTYFYVSLTSFKICTTFRQKIYSIIGILFSSIFILLLLIPGSPAFISKYAMYVLLIWFVIGLIVYTIVFKRFKSKI